MVTVISVFNNPGATILTGRIFGLDSQLLFDILFQGVAVFFLFMLLTKILIEPVNKVISDRQSKIVNDIEAAASDKKAAAELKADYDSKIKNITSEADEILSDARKKAKRNEVAIIDEAKEEATRIITRANQEIELEKSKVKEEVRTEIINVATIMAEKIVEAKIDDNKQADLIDATLKEMGDSTWLSK